MNASVYVCTRARVPGALTWGVEEPARSNPAGVAVELPTLSKGRPSSGFCTPGARNSPLTRGLSVCARALLLPFLAFGLRATPQAAGSFAQQLLDVESALMRGCGTACLDVLHEVTSNFSGGAESRGDVLRRVADHRTRGVGPRSADPGAHAQRTRWLLELAGPDAGRSVDGFELDVAGHTVRNPGSLRTEGEGRKQVQLRQACVAIRLQRGQCPCARAECRDLDVVWLRPCAKRVALHVATAVADVCVPVHSLLKGVCWVSAALGSG